MYFLGVISLLTLQKEKPISEEQKQGKEGCKKAEKNVKNIGFPF